MMKNKDFVVFILTHGRPDSVITVNTLEKCGYTGKIYFIVDNEDKTAQQYIKLFGKENVKIFDKKKYADSIDEGNNFDERRTITHARNACFDIAKELGFTYFIELDDDYRHFYYTSDSKFNYRSDHKIIKNIDKIFDLYIDFFKGINCKAVAFAQGGDFIGGEGSNVWNKPLSRKCMNSFICSTKKPFKLVGAMNEDVNTYTTLGSRGKLFFTTRDVRLEQERTQAQSGGITDMYLLYGTFCKSFTTVMMMPSSVSIRSMGVSNRSLHHSISWKHTVPQIIDEKYKITVN